MLRGTLRPVAVPAPLIGFVREHHGARVLALFNLSDGRIAFDRTQFGRMEVMAGSGFADPGSHLPPFGAVFASIEPAAFVSALSFR